jgi:hypothetical protein
MLRTLAYTTLCSAALIGPGAFADDNSAVPANASAAQTQASAGLNFVTNQEKTQWRAPKLIGVGVTAPTISSSGRLTTCWSIVTVRPRRS